MNNGPGCKHNHKLSHMSCTDASELDQTFVTTCQTTLDKLITIIVFVMGKSLAHQYS